MIKKYFQAISVYSFLITIVLFMIGCNDTTVPVSTSDNSHSITTVKLEFRDSASGQILNYFYRDLDGDNGNVPTQWDTIKIKANSIYYVSTSFINEANPNVLVNLTSDILNDKTNRLVCYNIKSADANISISDTDGKFPIGISTKWKTQSASKGSVNVDLKNQTGIKDGTCEPGISDITVGFQISIFP